MNILRKGQWFFTHPSLRVHKALSFMPVHYSAVSGLVATIKKRIVIKQTSNFSFSMARLLAKASAIACACVNSLFSAGFCAVQDKYTMGNSTHQKQEELPAMLGFSVLN